MSSDGLLSLRWNNHRPSFMQTLATLRNKESYSDITLSCDGKFYSVHKLVLSTCSDYFVEVLERTPCKHPIIVLKDIRHQDLEALLNYMYLGEVSVIQNDLTSLIKAAECLQIKGLAVPDESPPLEEDFKNGITNCTGESTPKKRRCDDDPTGVESFHSSKRTSHKPREFSNNTGTQESSRSGISHLQHQSQVFNDHSSDNQQESYMPEMVAIKEEPNVKYEHEESFSIPSANRNLVENSSPLEGVDSQGDSGETFEDLVMQAMPGPSLQCDGGQSWNEVQCKRNTSNYHMQGYPEQEGGPSNQSLQSMNMLDQGRNHVCLYCNKVFEYSSILERHMRIHTGEKPYGCSLCPYRTAQRGNLERHRMTHTSRTLPPIEQDGQTLITPYSSNSN